MGPRCPYTFNKQLFLINPHIKTNSRFFFYALTRFGKLKHFPSSFTNFHHTLFTLLPLRTKLQQAVAASRLVVQLIFSQHFFLLWLKGFHTLFFFSANCSGSWLFVSIFLECSRKTLLRRRLVVRTGGSGVVIRDRWKPQSNSCTANVFSASLTLNASNALFGSLITFFSSGWFFAFGLHSSAPKSLPGELRDRAEWNHLI